MMELLDETLIFSCHRSITVLPRRERSYEYVSGTGWAVSEEDYFQSGGRNLQRVGFNDGSSYPRYMYSGGRNLQRAASINGSSHPTRILSERWNAERGTASNHSSYPPRRRNTVRAAAIHDSSIPPSMHSQRRNTWRAASIHDSAVPPRMRTNWRDIERDAASYVSSPPQRTGSGDSNVLHYNIETLDPIFQSMLAPIDTQNENNSSCLSDGLISENLKIALGCSRSEQEICTICQDIVEMNEEMASLHCGHSYHVECIKRWLMVKNECAVCRASTNSTNRR